MEQNLESIFDYYPFFIHIILTFSQNTNEKISLNSLELLKKAIIFIEEKIASLKTETKKQVNLFETIPSSSEILTSQLENWQNTLNSTSKNN